MKSVMLNKANVQGILYNQDLTLQTTGANSKNPGTEYIRGSISIAVDPEMTNIIDVHFLYVTENTKKGKSATFTVLKKIIDGTLPNHMEHNCDTTFLSVNTSIGLNEFYSKNTGEERLVSNQRYIGGLVRHIKENELAPVAEAGMVSERNNFLVEGVITNINRLDADPEQELPERMAVRGAIFDFRKALLPVEFVLYGKKGMDFLEDNEVSSKHPMFLMIEGYVNSSTIVRKVEEETVFGPPIVRMSTKTRKEFVINSFNPGLWDDPSTITEEELRNAMTERNVYLATIKQRQDEYEASKNNINVKESADEYDF